MLTKKFTLPDPEVARKETQKRLNLLNEFLPSFLPISTAVVSFGSLATGRNYSVHKDSDIDLLILTTPEKAKQISDLKLFDEKQLGLYIEGYEREIARQFSLNFIKEEVSLECHFWDESAYLDTISLLKAETMRFRSSDTTPSTNYSYSFDGSEYVTEPPSMRKDKWIISPFPTYLEKENKFYPCRPLTNVLGNPFIVHGENVLKDKINSLWTLIVKKLVENRSPVDLSECNILKSLPGHWKFSPETEQYVMTRTEQELQKLGIPFKK
ncbi:MAG: hypothetical protein UV58_C0011G0019 [Candidatus Wolfebacteria bacterium GW2011_GWC1_43_10]|uniref:Polymerase nucleotidyl transferase domain-containing protein n=2 Tax=Candidatus Wolfeibacteriota TaxID=1752735 RepID=A0A0G1C9D6_9BACT|nr:MAG: hypothetical protein UV58_C0011G0019 [Candidatus Wolfebacteria bacterium GW2011_GWC1_43_10]KKT22580.1 MAG: hypothetical protein UW08_C0006G0020 [Parcubacteria group bacterium GW2011_GWB1_43_8b]OGM89860.1 MAG: hypothetical protein A2108_00995 [Candidatus Wolfebacteria bacterium GWA1_42_9]